MLGCSLGAGTTGSVCGGVVVVGEGTCVEVVVVGETLSDTLFLKIFKKINYRSDFNYKYIILKFSRRRIQENYKTIHVYNILINIHKNMFLGSDSIMKIQLRSISFVQ